MRGTIPAIALALSCASSRPAPLPVDPEAPPAATPSPSAPGRVGADTAPFRLAWVSAEERGGRHVVIAPWGDVLGTSYRGSHLLSRRDGSLLESADCCDDVVAVDFVADRVALFVTSGGAVIEMTFPGMVTRPAFRFALASDHSARIALAAVAADTLAFATRDHQVWVVGRPGYGTRLRLQLEDDVRGLALSPTGDKLAIGADTVGLAIHDLKRGTRVLLPDHELRSLSFSPDGKELFGRSSAGPVVVDAGRGVLLRQYANREWTEHSRYLSPRLVVTSSHDGLRLYHSGAAEPQKLPLPKKMSSLDGLGVASNGTMICAGTGSRVVCFSNTPPRPSGYEPPPPLVGEPWKEDE